MAPQTSSNNARFWRANWFAGVAVVGVAVVIAVLLLSQVSVRIGTLERSLYNVGSTSTSRLPSERIAIIVVDDQSIANTGRFPWRSDVHPNLADQLAEAKTIVHTAVVIEPQADRGFGHIRKLKSLLPSADAPSVQPGDGGVHHGATILIVGSVEEPVPGPARMASVATGARRQTIAVAAGRGHDRTAELATAALAAEVFQIAAVHNANGGGGQDDAFQKTAVQHANLPGADVFEKKSVHLEQAGHWQGSSGFKVPDVEI